MEPRSTREENFQSVPNVKRMFILNKSLLRNCLTTTSLPRATLFGIPFPFITTNSLHIKRFRPFQIAKQQGLTTAILTISLHRIIAMTAGNFFFFCPFYLFLLNTAIVFQVYKQQAVALIKNHFSTDVQYKFEFITRKFDDK